MKQLFKLEELFGKIIKKSLLSYDELWMRFTDGSFVVFNVVIGCEGFSYAKTTIEISDEIMNNTHRELVELGLIIQEVYEEALQEEEEEYELLRQQREKELYEQQELENEIKERDLYEQLKKKYN